MKRAEQTGASKRFRSKIPHFVCNMPLRNRLPEPLPGPKLAQLPTDLQSFVEFKPTSLDTDYKWKHHSERTLGVSVDLVDLEAHRPQPKEERPEIHPDDARILHWGAGKQGGGGGGQANKVAHVWLKNTSFMSNDLTQQVHKFKSGSQVMKEEHERIVQINNTLGTDAETLTENAEKSFDVPFDKLVAASAKRKGLTAEWVMPLLPDALLWANDFVHVDFEVDPAPRDPRKRARVAGGMLVNAKPVYNEKQQKNVVKGSFILPKEEGSKGEHEEQEFEWERQYTVETKDADKNFVLMVDPDVGTVTYVEHSSSKVEFRSGLAAAIAKKESGGTFTVKRCELTREEVLERNRNTREVDHFVALSDGEADEPDEPDDGEDELGEE